MPFRIEDVGLSKKMRYFIGTPHWLDAVLSPLEPHLQRLVEAVGQLLSGAELEPTQQRPAVAARRHNLPHGLPSFIGRESEKSEVNRS